MFRYSSKKILCIVGFLISLSSYAANDAKNDQLQSMDVNQQKNEETAQSIKKGNDLIAKPKPVENPVSKRIRKEAKVLSNDFAISPHRPNYFLPVSYMSNTLTNHIAPNNPYSSKLNNTEIKFQLSIKAPIMKDLFGGRAIWYAAYTNTSWWQAYNNSAFFRETNHEPETFLLFPTDLHFKGITLRAISVGLDHQSNGQAGVLSRSWNRAYAQLVFEKGPYFLSIKPWWRFHEHKKRSAVDFKGDDNPDIEKYLGYGELRFGVSTANYGNLLVMLRNNLRSKRNLGAVEVDWSFPLYGKFKGLIQYFNGYGDSLIDYNKSVSRISFGVLLTDWV